MSTPSLFAGPDSSPSLFPEAFEQAPAARTKRRTRTRKHAPAPAPVESRPKRQPEGARFDDDAEKYDGLS